MGAESLVDGWVGTFTQQLYSPVFTHYHLYNVIHLYDVIHAGVTVWNIICASRDRDYCPSFLLPSKLADYK